MIYLFIIAVLADLWTTDRALKRHPRAVESHPILSRIFGDRPTRTQFALAAIVQAVAWVWGLAYINAPPEMLFIPAAFHAWAAGRNYLNERNHGHT